MSFYWYPAHLLIIAGLSAVPAPVLSQTLSASRGAAVPDQRAVSAPTVLTVKDGAEIRVAGTQKMERFNNREYLTLKTDKGLAATTKVAAVHEIGIRLAGQENALKANAGKAATVAGAVQFGATSPFEFNGTLLTADSVVLADGTVLLPLAQTDLNALPSTLERFHAEVTMTRNGYPRFAYKAWNPGGQLMPADATYLTCDLNGNEEKMNCYCAGGFVTTELGQMHGARFDSTEKPKSGFAQYPVPKDPTESMSRAVECTRRP